MLSNHESRSPRLAFECLEDRCLPATNLFAVGADAGAPPHVKVYDANTGAEVFSFYAYDPAFRGGVHVAVGDFNGDGNQDIITGAGPGAGPHVKVFDGLTLNLLANFYAYDPAFTGGVTVASGRFNLGNGLGLTNAIVTGAGPGADPHVKVFIPGVGESASFLAFDAGFRGGISVAAGNTTSLGSDSIVVGAGPGAPGGHVKVFGPQTTLGGTRQGVGTGISYNPFAELRSFFAFDPSYTAGVSVACGNVDEVGGADIVVGAGPGVAGGQVKVFSNDTSIPPIGFNPFPSSFTGETRIATADINGDTRRDILVSSSAVASGVPQVQIFDAVTLALIDSLVPFGASYLGGTFVGSASS